MESNISTFLLEMRDAAHIVVNAAERSLVLVDELGRGTSNKEGSAIAWGVAEALLSANSYTLFVTHYPLLMSLSPLYPNVRNVHLAIDAKQARGGAAASPEGGFEYRHIVEEGPSQPASDYGGLEFAYTQAQRHK